MKSNILLSNRSVKRISPQLLLSLHKHWQLYVLLLPSLLYLFIFNYIPMYGVQIAFKDFSSARGIWGSAWVGFKHFERFISYPNFVQMMWNTFSINFYSLLVGFPAPIIMALLINEVQNKALKRAVQMISYAPHFMSTVVVCGMIILFTNKESGFINHILGFVGFERIDFMSIPRWFKTVFVLSGVWQNAGWNTIIYLSALSGVSVELYEAGYMDGANRLQIIRYINIPYLLPTIIILFILNCGSLFSLGFEKIWLLQNPLNLDASEVISTYVYKVGIQGAQYSYSSAIGLFNTVLNFIILLAMNKLSKRMSDIAIL